MRDVDIIFPRSNRSAAAVKFRGDPVGGPDPAQPLCRPHADRRAAGARGRGRSSLREGIRRGLCLGGD